MSDVTYILQQIDSGDRLAAEQLLPLVYEELRRLAASKLSDERPDQTLQATALVHEAFVRLVDVENAQKWNSRGHFFAAAAEAMRRILVEKARRRQRLKHGAAFQHSVFEEIPVVADNIQEDLIDLDEALTKLEATDPQAAQLIQLRYFVGLSIPDAAHALGISPRTADRLWAFARAWLHREISGIHRSEEDSSEFLA
jgi:RNA polymerase sigma factor (TIGR02999 family)